jgi:hypothetical protein
MSDDLMDRGQRDKARIDLSRDYERRDWAKSFGVTEDELKDAVHAAGDSADKVRNYLQAKDFIRHLNDYIRDRKPPSRA